MVFLRSSVMDTEEEMASYLPPAKPAKMPSQAVFFRTGLKPAALPMAMTMSGVKPTMFLLASTISMGGYVASTAKTISLARALPAIRQRASRTRAIRVRIRPPNRFE
jgi:hypothetical protein